MATLPATSKAAKSSLFRILFSRPLPLYLSAFLLRLVLLLYGLWQDANSPLKYTDIDYLVFTDAARFVSRGESPYARETYRYTPILAWLLLPTTWTAGAQWGPLAVKVINAAWFSFGKVLFAAADLVAGWLIERVLVMGTDLTGATSSSSSSSINGNETATKKDEEEVNGGGARGMAPSRARAFAAIWLLNPMVATISTRGSSEGLLGVLVMALLWAVLSRRITLAGLLLGFSVHFKIYPFIYAPAIVWWMDAERLSGIRGTSQKTTSSFLKRINSFITLPRLQLGLTSLLTFFGLNILMYALYGHPFLQETYLHHVTRIDHRHNFSPYNTQLYLSSAATESEESSKLKIESLAFLPQLLLSTVLIPFFLAKKDLPTSFLAQTFAFVTFNKVCTSQYFLWYMVFLPLYLPTSSFLKSNKLGLSALALWVLGQGLWLQQGFQLEFLGRSTFLPGLWMASLGFFVVNCWILGGIVGDGGR